MKRKEQITSWESERGGPELARKDLFHRNDKGRRIPKWGGGREKELSCIGKLNTSKRGNLAPLEARSRTKEGVVWNLEGRYPLRGKACKANTGEK